MTSLMLLAGGASATWGHLPCSSMALITVAQHEQLTLEVNQKPVISFSGTSEIRPSSGPSGLIFEVVLILKI